ncbi:HAD family hydrolase [Flavimaricola marinus]|uniref:Pyrimidine 5'-nucleotidase YjjG n=1 Tax=Flavimaricola marinus TaxID=1819565 RepID=A0A238LC51_9RHOB|nr:HAD family hydrolase [Flavimaricola marinus]SMY07269.1 Pyrimidine 5'-nucleotidase YjjG [Flavimaricola marinus]
MIQLQNGSGADFDLAHRHRPLLRMDVAEPYAPVAMGYTLFRTPDHSPSSKFEITPKASLCTEYAIWYDWDIGHLYDLEHVWVHLDASDQVVAVEASFHGQRVPMDLAGGLPRIADGRPVLYIEPGKHAHWADGIAMAALAGTKLCTLCGAQAGIDGVHRGNPFFEAEAYQITPLMDRLAQRKMQRDSFVPRFCFSRSGDDTPVMLTDWAALAAWIPSRVSMLMQDLPKQVPHLAAVLLDCGDTLIDEATEIKIPGTEVATEAKEIPHAMDAVHRLNNMGYPLALVADGSRATFENLLKPCGIWDLMQAHVTSDDIGEPKPSARMFDAALDALRVRDADRNTVVMVGNNLERAIRGANDAGLLSLFVSWSKRRSQTPEISSDIPDAQIGKLDQLVGAIEAFERALPEVVNV